MAQGAVEANENANARNIIVQQLQELGVPRAMLRVILPQMATDVLAEWADWLKDGGRIEEMAATLKINLGELLAQQQAAQQQAAVQNGKRAAVQQQGQGQQRAVQQGNQQRGHNLNKQGQPQGRQNNQQRQRGFAQQVAHEMARENTAYSRIGVVFALITALLFWVAIYGLNIFSTSWAIKSVVDMIGAGLMRLAGSNAETPGEISWTIGGALGIGISAIQFHMWRLRSRQAYANIIPASFADLFSAAIAVKMVIRGTLASTGYLPWVLLENFVYTLLGATMSLAPEPMILYLLHQLGIRFGWINPEE